MPLIVQKFGGTSVGSIENIHLVAEHVIKAQQQGNQVVVVVSAMAGETNRLLGLAQQIDEIPTAREVDVLLSAGEQVSIALLAITLNSLGYPAHSLTGGQAKIHTNNHYNDASIDRIDTSVIQASLAQGNIVVVAGFQGVDDNGNITTLGRGGSDTTAVALAGALKAQECQIFTDVDGIYTSDPRIVPSAQKLPSIDFLAMEEMARMGAKVLHLPSVQYAHRHKVPLRVVSTFDDGIGSLVHTAPSDHAFCGVAIQSSMMLIQADSEVYATLIKHCNVFGVEVWDIAQNEQSCTFVMTTESYTRLKYVFADKVDSNEVVSLLTLIGRQAALSLNEVSLLLQEHGILPKFQFTQPRSSVVVLCPSCIEQAANVVHDAYIVPCALALSN